ncbi:MAG: carbohydrate ABC transporter permease [Lachnospiraceae bacterium]|nr:carbohydrate ABC transporter permease [Lachnospiraceae bacterium]
MAQATTKAAFRPHKLTETDKDKIQRFLFGSKEQEGFLKQLVVYALLICIGFIYLYPILYMLSSSLMNLDDLLDSSINWIPSTLNLANYAQAGKSMDFWKSLVMSIIIAGVPTILNVLSCSVVGYGLARFEFPGKKAILGVIIFSFILPSQVTMIPTYVLYNNIGILGSLKAFILPSLLAQGINAPIFILIFFQFFRQVPKVLIEAAQIDGAGYFKSFIRISLPSAAPAILTVFLFSFVWYWNESYLTQMYVSGIMTESGWTSLVIQLDKFASNYSQYAQTAQSGATSLNESISMAGTMLSILPVLIMYFVLQRYFVESIDRAGITGE